jgi:hypothetical protein
VHVTVVACLARGALVRPSSSHSPRTRTLTHPPAVVSAVVQRGGATSTPDAGHRGCDCRWRWRRRSRCS